MTTDLNDVRGQVEILKWCKAKRAEIAELEKQAKEVVQAALGDAEFGSIDGELAVTWKTTKRRALDQKLLAELYPDVAEECKSVTEVRRFEVCD